MPQLKFTLTILGIIPLFLIINFVVAFPINIESQWGIEDIRLSRNFFEVDNLISKKLSNPQIDPSDLLVIVESDRHSVSILDIKLYKIIHRFKFPYTLNQNTQFSPNRRFVYFSSVEGWLIKFDMIHLSIVARIRTGIITKSVAISADGRYLLVANNSPRSLVLLNATNFDPLKLIPISSTDDQRIIVDASARRSFIVVLKDMAEVREILYEDDPLPVYNGLMHDYRLGEGMAKQIGKFPIRRIKLEYCSDNCLNDVIIYSPSGYLIVSNKNQIKIIQMDARRKISEIDMEDKPNLESGIIWHDKNKLTLAISALNKPEMSFIDMNNWGVIKHLKIDGPSFLLKSHESSNYIWTGISLDHSEVAFQIISKDTLTIVKTILLPTKRKVMDVIFDQQRDRVLVMLGNIAGNGEIVIYDEKSLKEVSVFHR